MAPSAEPARVPRTGTARRPRPYFEKQLPREVIECHIFKGELEAAGAELCAQQAPTHTHTTQAPLASGPTGLGQEGDVGTEDAAARPWTLPEAWADGPLSPFSLQDPRPGPRQPDCARVRFGGLRRPWGAQPPGCRPRRPRIAERRERVSSFPSHAGKGGRSGSNPAGSARAGRRGPEQALP